MKIDTANKQLMEAIDKEIEKYKNHDIRFYSVCFEVGTVQRTLRDKAKELENLARERGDLLF